MSMSLISIGLNSLLNAAHGIFMGRMLNMALAPSAKPYVVKDNLTFGVSPLRIRNALIHSPIGGVI
jgi:hypothetical protein